METITIPSPSAFLSRSPMNDTQSLSHPSPTQLGHSAHPRPLASSAQAPITAGLQNGGAAKPKQSKSRNGCITCKGKRLKCDETKPDCEQCRKRNVKCGRYSKAFKWRSFEEANFNGKSGSKPKKVSPPPALSASRNAYAADQSRSSPSTDFPSEATAGVGGADHDFEHRLSRTNVFNADHHILPLSSNNTRVTVSPTFPNQSTYMPQPQMQHVYQPQPFLDSYSPSIYPEMQPSSGDSSQPNPLPPTRQASTFATGSPRLQDILLPGTDLNSPPPPIEPRPPQSPLPYMPSGHTPPGDDEAAADDDVEEIVRSDDPGLMDDSRHRTLSNNWSSRLPSASPSPSESSSSSSSTSSALDLWAQPRLAANSQEMLVVRFDHQTCGILSVKDGPNENPWRTVVWPMAQDSKPLYHALASLTAFHSSMASPELRVDGMKHMHQSVTKLAGTLNNMKFNDSPDGNEIEAALATTLVLAFSESWDQHVSTGIKHLKGAKYFVDQAVVKHQKALREGIYDSRQMNRLKFLCNTFIYMDVIARLTSLEEEDFLDLDNILTTFNQPYDNMTEIDPLMGAASTLFPLIGRLAAIITRVRKSENNSFTLISDAIELKKKIEQWEPLASASFEVPEDPTSEVQHSIQTAEAYRWAALLFLHQAVPEIPSEPAAVLAERVLKYLATVPLSSRAIIVQIFPLLAASCEALQQEDRNWVKGRWAAMSARMSIGNVDVCLEVVKETWERRDQFEAEKADRLVRRQAARGLSTHGMFSTAPGGRLKRKASDTDTSNGEGYFNDSGMSEPTKLASGSFLKRRVMADPNGLPSALGVDDCNNAASVHMDFYQNGMPLPTQSPLALPSPTRKRSNEAPLEGIEAEFTVRGRLHWIGVMSDHKWEVLLG